MFQMLGVYEIKLTVDVLQVQKLSQDEEGEKILRQRKWLNFVSYISKSNSSIERNWKP